MAGYINDDRAYNDAVKRKIQANARKGRFQRWIDEDPSRENLIKVLEENFHAPRGNSFLVKMFQSFEEWGSLTPGQEAAVQKVIAQDAERKAEWAKKNAEEGARSQHVGTEGERGEFLNLKLRFKKEFDGRFGPTTIQKFEDEAGNVLVYFGKDLGVEKDGVISLKATVKKHDERDGVKQTILNRPTVL